MIKLYWYNNYQYKIITPQKYKIIVQIWLYIYVCVCVCVKVLNLKYPIKFGV